MIGKLITILMAAIPILTEAQITLNAQLPPGGLVRKDQLWNLVLSNNHDGLTQVSITMYLKDAVSGQTVMSANSAQVPLAKGSKLITAKDLEPIIYNANSLGLSGNYISLGAYIACYQVFEQSHTEGSIIEDCININVDPLSPPLLNSPLDASEIETPYPQFTWIPPAPVEMFSDLNYDILVAEVMEGQSPTESLQYNSPAYSKTGLTKPFEIYPASFSKLETGKTYAWQVVAKNEMNYAAKTDVWTFKLKKEEKPADIVSLTPYVKLKTSSPEKGIAPNGIIKVAYNNRTPEKTIKIEVIESPGQDKGQKETAVFEIELIRGENNIEYDLHKVMKPEEGKIYIARLVNSLNEIWFVQFVVKKFK